MKPRILPFIFASGQGTRLRPLTDSTPKPLMPVKGDQTLLDLILKQVINYGFTEVLINYSYRQDLFLQVVKNYSDQIKIVLVDDQAIVGQGGIILQQRPAFTDYDYVFGLNGDTICDFDLDRFVANPQPTEVRLLTNNNYDVRHNLLCDQSGQVLGIENNEKDPYWYVSNHTVSQKNNYLGTALFPVKPLDAVNYAGDFMGFFKPGELIEQLIHNQIMVRTLKVPIKQFLTANTLDELNALRAALQ